VKLLKGAATGKPLLGGEYTLVNQDGKVMRNTDFHGTWAFLYFGFTYCPDICPNELTRLQEILSILDKVPSFGLPPASCPAYPGSLLCLLLLAVGAWAYLSQCAEVKPLTGKQGQGGDASLYYH